jgi:lysophospholipase L1-like esterase
MKDIRICYIGDSFVNGTGDPEKLGWTGRLSAASQKGNSDITHYNLGIRRETSADILLRWESECQIRLPEISENKVVFSFGVNDTVIENNQERVALKQSMENTKAILVKASQIYDVMMVGPPPIADQLRNKRIKILDEQFLALLDRLNIPYVSVFHKLISSDVWVREVSDNDGAHPRANGYALWANYLEHHKNWWYSPLNLPGDP